MGSRSRIHFDATKASARAIAPRLSDAQTTSAAYPPAAICSADLDHLLTRARATVAATAQDKNGAECLLHEVQQFCAFVEGV